MPPSPGSTQSRESLHPARILTATSLFDGHDAAINIVRRLLQAAGAEVIHLGHDRSVDEIVRAAIQEDVHAIAVSSYQGGHMEFFRYLVDQLRARNAAHIRVYVGGGGTILPAEIAELTAYGVARIFTPDDGRKLGLAGMVQSLLAELDPNQPPSLGDAPQRLSVYDPQAVARTIAWLEYHAQAADSWVSALRAKLDAGADQQQCVVLGITGTGGAGKSSLVDELLLRLRKSHPELSVGLLLVDPSKRRTGGALLGDRIRMNSLASEHIYARSLATRRAHLALSAAVGDGVRVLRAAGYPLVIVETAGIGQSDTEIVELADLSVYVMTPDFGAPSQLEKIDMLEFADLVVLNKFDRRGGEDALRDVRKQWRRNHARLDVPDEEVPVFATIASRWNEPGLDRLYAALMLRLAQSGVAAFRTMPPTAASQERAVAAPSWSAAPLIPSQRIGHLAEVAEAVRSYRSATKLSAKRAGEVHALHSVLVQVGDEAPTLGMPYAPAAPAAHDAFRAELRQRYAHALAGLEPALRAELIAWPASVAQHSATTQSEVAGEHAVASDSQVPTLSGTLLPRVALPRTEHWGELARFLRQENLPGHFPFTAGVFPRKQRAEDPTRMFAGEGGPERTNQRFHMLAAGQSSVRLSTAFDSVTLYGRDPDERADIYGKVGNSGVSVCTLDDAKKLYSGFDLCASSTSVSMTINGPAPIILAFFLNAAIDQEVEKHLRAQGRFSEVRARHALSGLPTYLGALPRGHNGLGLGLLGIAGSEAVDAQTYARIKAEVLCRIRGTVQADILKEDQAQNTCIFATDFALRMMGDVQAYFIEHGVRKFYSVSVSGYHIAEAGANPITQLAFTLANAFTYVEHYLSRGMRIDDFAPSFSFFFSQGLDAEYNVLGRVARRIWAIALREIYRASERSQKLKYHIQTSGRGLHAQEMGWNDIRTTLSALSAIADQCSSLHTNAFDEAVTTPTEESVRTAVAIQLIIQRELGLTQNDNPLQGSYFLEELSDRVEAAVLQELDRLSQRGGVLGSMETLYQRGKIQDESMLYESRKHTGELAIVGINTFLRPEAQPYVAPELHAVRATPEDKQAQVRELRAFQARAGQHTGPALARLQAVARASGNVFEELMQTVQHASLGQITDALFQVGGRYRRSM